MAFVVLIVYLTIREPMEY